MDERDAARYEKQEKEREKEGGRKNGEGGNTSNCKILKMQKHYKFITAANITYTLCKKIVMSFIL